MYLLQNYNEELKHHYAICRNSFEAAKNANSIPATDYTLMPTISSLLVPFGVKSKYYL